MHQLLRIGHRQLGQKGALPTATRPTQLSVPARAYGRGMDVRDCPTYATPPARTANTGALAYGEMPLRVDLADEATRAGSCGPLSMSAANEPAGAPRRASPLAAATRHETPPASLRGPAAAHAQRPRVDAVPCQEPATLLPGFARRRKTDTPRRGNTNPPVRRLLMSRHRRAAQAGRTVTNAVTAHVAARRRAPSSAAPAIPRTAA